jgi:tetratricopeptide (TPR) repeat protein
MQQATAALNTGAYPELQRLCKQILNIDKNQADAWFFMSIVAEAGRQPGHALQFVDRALDIKADHVEYLAQKAKLHSLLNQYSEAQSAVSRAIECGSEQAIVLDTLGVVLTRIGRHGKARDLLERAVRKEPGNPQYQFNLASAEQFLGHDEAARLAYERAIALKPDFSRAYWALSELEKNQAEPGRLEQLLTLHDSPATDSIDRLYLAHAIARAHEAQGDFDRAFSCLSKAKQQRKQDINYSIGSDINLFAELESVFSRAAPQAAETDPLDGRAIFVIGMPRSGTTLLERILSSHSRVLSLGELQEFPRALKQLAGTRSPVVLDAETIAAAARQDMAALGSSYTSMLGDRVPTGKNFIDKLPLNFFCVGFIMAALPAAKVICLRRNPLDTILSNYRQLFALNFSYYNYHYDLADTARFFVEFDRLMTFWQSQYRERFFQLHYESLVEEPEPSIREVLKYLQLDWEPGCLEFHKQDGAVATASASQVRQPLYNTAVARWKKYELHLAPAMEVLDKAGINYR